MRQPYRLLNRRHEHWILASMLLVLHCAIDAGLDNALAAALMTAHLGLFFLWQPIWQKDQRVDLPGALLIVLLVGGMLAALNGWIVFGWLIVLIGIIAGRSFSTRRERYIYMVSLAILISELLVVCAAPLFLSKPIAPLITEIFRLGLYLAPALLYAVPPLTAPSREPFPVDFFRGITFALMTALLAVMSALMSLRFGLDYALALVAALIALGVMLLLLSWITTPGRSIGLLAVWEKSVLNIGTPFEAWLGDIANLAHQRAHAEDFLQAAVGALADIPWISGVEWHTRSASGLEGTRTHNHLEVDTGELRVLLFTERSFSSALLIHCRLLIQVLGHFYVAKQRENDEASEAHLRAIYETGARVTHDIKNLLQSLQPLASALQTVRGAEQEHRGFVLMQRRLPEIAQRLKLALDKLQKPREQAQDLTEVTVWWSNLCRRHDEPAIRFSAELHNEAARIPRECFDSVIDNLIDNARAKVASAQAQQIEVRLNCGKDDVYCVVSDDGPHIPEIIARDLFLRPVPSASGLGIGLYQAARQAQRADCTLALKENRDGAVCFELRYAQVAVPAQTSP